MNVMLIVVVLVIVMLMMVIVVERVAVMVAVMVVVMLVMIVVMVMVLDRAAVLIFPSASPDPHSGNPSVEARVIFIAIFKDLVLIQNPIFFRCCPSFAVHPKSVGAACCADPDAFEDLVRCAGPIQSAGFSRDFCRFEIVSFADDVLVCVHDIKVWFHSVLF